MSDTPTPSPLFDALTLWICDEAARALQPETYPAAHKSVAISAAYTTGVKTDTARPRGWMHPAANFSPELPVVVVPARFSATVHPIRPAPAPVAAPPDLHDCVVWGAFDGTHGTVQRLRHGIVLMATNGVSGCRVTASATLQPDAARQLAHVLLAAHAAALRDPSERFSLGWGDPAGVSGRVTLHRFGVSVLASADIDGDSIATTLQFRSLDVVREVGNLLFAQADAHDAEFDEGDLS